MEDFGLPPFSWSAIQMLPTDWKRPTGRPSHTWLCAIEVDLKPVNIDLSSA